MRILRLIHSTERQSGGPIEGIYQNTRILAQLGHQTQVISLRGQKEHHPELRLDILPFPSKGHYGVSLPFLRYLLRHAQDFNLIIVHGDWQFHGLCALLMSVLKGVPYVVYTHGMLDPWFKATYPLKHLKKLPYWLLIERWVLKRAQRVLFTSQLERDLARQPFPFYQCREMVIGYGTSPYPKSEDLSPLFFEAHPELKERRILLFMSRLHPKKGCDLLLKAFAEVHAQHPNCQLVMAGPDQVSWKKELEEMCEQLQIQKAVTWTGMLEGDLKFAAIDACEAFILPSHQENFGIVVAEALSRGRPVLISDQVNIYQEILKHEAGWVAPDTLEGCRQLLAIWFDQTPAQQERMQKNARACFSECFDLQHQAQQILQLAQE